MRAYEQPGSFYLGREVDPSSAAGQADLLLYDSRDLTTHAVCVGMTGSGKTGLCISLLEEAAIDGVPAIAIDPKGDLGNLRLTFPLLRAEDFAPWIDPAEGARKNMTRADYAASIAESWRKGLEQWDQDGARIQRFRDAAEVVIYTPGSEAGRQLSVLKSFSAPSADLRGQPALLRERIAATAAGLLALVDVDADPIRSREHILLSMLFEAAWSSGHDLDLAALIQGVQKPPFEKVGVLDLEAFYSSRERSQLALSLNNLLAAPGFAAWMQGEPLDVQRLLFTAEGKPRIAIISIAHLNDAQRMFVVTLLLGEVVAWMRTQSGTSSLRALLYMDEIFGYFPPTAMPPSKEPLLTLMKQARAFGLGVVLATQNPVDLDYKGLANAGTWFIGRLQTERDKARVVEGLLGAAGEGLDKSQLDTLLSNLDSRVFLMRNVHEDAPLLFRTRWALSYLRGPMTLQEIAALTAPQERAAAIAATAQPEQASSATPSGPSVPAAGAQSTKPVIPAQISEYYLRRPDPSRPEAPSASPTFTPRVLGVARLHFVSKGMDVDVWETRTWIAPMKDSAGPDWAAAELAGALDDRLSSQAPAQGNYADTPAALLVAKNYESWRKELASHIYRCASFTALRCPDISAVHGGSEADFRARLSLLVREKRDSEVDKLRRSYAPRLAGLQAQIRRAEDRVKRERSQLAEQQTRAAISIGTSILGTLLGRKKITTANVGRLGTAARGAGRIGRERDDIGRAEESLEALGQRLKDMQNELEQDISTLASRFDPANARVERIEIKPRKSDIEMLTMALLWVEGPEARAS